MKENMLAIIVFHDIIYSAMRKSWNAPTAVSHCCIEPLEKNGIIIGSFNCINERKLRRIKKNKVHLDTTPIEKSGDTKLQKVGLEESLWGASNAF